MQTAIVTLVAAGALIVLIRRFTGLRMPIAFRPAARRPAGCDSCPIAPEALPKRQPDAPPAVPR